MATSATQPMDPRCIVLAAQGGGDMQVFGRDNYLYGTLRGGSSSGGVLSCNEPPHSGNQVLKFEVGDSTKKEIFAKSMLGETLATAMRVDDSWRVHVRKGVDSVS